MPTQNFDPIKLPLIDIFKAKKADPSILQKVEHELTSEDYHFYDLHGWKNYHPKNHTQILLPSLGEPLYYRGTKDVVIQINNQNYLFEFISDYNYEPWEVDEKFIVLTPTNLPPTTQDGTKESHYYQFFGQPRWIQGGIYPLNLEDKPCSHLVTIENGWGDSGNYNILVGLDEKNMPNLAYFEASCC